MTPECGGPEKSDKPGTALRRLRAIDTEQGCWPGLWMLPCNERSPRSTGCGWEDVSRLSGAIAIVDLVPSWNDAFQRCFFAANDIDNSGFALRNESVFIISKDELAQKYEGLKRVSNEQPENTEKRL
jgi:hypothetical protein